MPLPHGPPKIYLLQGIVKATDIENRRLGINILGDDRRLNNVILITDPNSYSFPNINDRVLILFDGTYAYCLGKIEAGYAEKIKGTAINGEEVLARKVKEGETLLGNLIKKTWLTISDNGNFSILNSLSDGLKYFVESRFLRIKGYAISLIGKGVSTNFGNVLRDIPSAGKKVISNPDNPLDTAVEVLFELFNYVGVKTFKFVRFHLGHVLNPLGKPEYGSIISTARLRALLEVCDPVSTPIAVLKMDELGHIEITSVIGQLVLNSNNDYVSGSSGVLIGGKSASQSAVFGDVLLDRWNKHTHPTGVGLSGTPTDPILSLDLLSKKVKIG